MTPQVPRTIGVDLGVHGVTRPIYFRSLRFCPTHKVSIRSRWVMCTVWSAAAPAVIIIIIIRRVTAFQRVPRKQSATNLLHSTTRENRPTKWYFEFARQPVFPPHRNNVYKDLYRICSHAIKKHPIRASRMPFAVPPTNRRYLLKSNKLNLKFPCYIYKHIKHIIVCIFDFWNATI